GNMIGGTTAAARNVISGNRDFGVDFFAFGPGATGNFVQGNFIGTDATGAAPLGNGGAGVILTSGAAGNTIAGTAAGAGNVIAGNHADGVRIAAPGTTGNLVQGNTIGTDAAGALDLGNASSGVVVDAGVAGNTIGGTAQGAGNIIAFN